MIGPTLPVVRLGSDEPPPRIRRWNWPASPMRRLRLAVAGIVLLWLLFLVVTALSQAGPDRALLITAASGLGLGLMLIRVYSRNRLSWTDQLGQLAFFAAANLTDGATQLGSGMIQIFVLAIGIYGRLRQCVVQLAASAVIAGTTVAVKQELGLPFALGVSDSLQNTIAQVTLCALTFAVASVVTRYELLVARDNTALRAGAALVAAQTRAHVYASVRQAATSLVDAPGDRAFVALHDGDRLLLIEAGDGRTGSSLSLGDLPASVAEALGGPSGPAGRVSETGDGALVALGEDDGRPAVLVVLTHATMLKHAVTGLRALEPAIQLALRNLELTEGLRRQAFQDSLTGLANRAAFHHRLPAALQPRPGGAGRVALLLLDLDGFKAVNDRLGHAAGDELLVETARRLLGCVRSTDLVGRLGGDEFVILLEDLEDDARAVAVADRVLAAVSAGVTALGLEIAVTTSVGIAFGHPGATDGDRLIAEADAAMYRAKATGKGRYCLHLPAPAPS